MFPTFYIDNVALTNSDTSEIRGNRVSDCTGVTCIGIQSTGDLGSNLLQKNNTCVRLRTLAGVSEGFHADGYSTIQSLYNTASRCNIGYHVHDTEEVISYNNTSHDNQTGFYTRNTPVYNIRNVCVSCYENHTSFQHSTAFDFDAASVAATVDYAVVFGTSTIVNNANISIGPYLYAEKPIYMNEPIDDLTPDNISIATNNGTNNYYDDTYFSIGGKHSDITTEATADKMYHYSMIDNTFWDVSDEGSLEVALIKAAQSRTVSAAEAALSTVVNDRYFKQLDSSAYYSELFPAYSTYESATQFSKHMFDLWFATTQPATIQSMQTSIGGYNLFPSFFKRADEFTTAWILGMGIVSFTNVLSSTAFLRYGIGVDVLGVSTLTATALDDTKNNTLQYASDLGPIAWILHDEVQPADYILYTDMWNGYEDTDLSYMRFNEDFNIEPTRVDIPSPPSGGPCYLTTGEIDVSGITFAPPDYVEVSLLDRVRSENANRELYYREGDNTGELVADPWKLIPQYIGGKLYFTKNLAQFRVVVTDHLRIKDYEFIGICLRWGQDARISDISLVPAPGVLRVIRIGNVIRIIFDRSIDG